MKSFFYLVAIVFFATACTIEKTDYQSEINTEVPSEVKFEPIQEFSQLGYNIRIETLNGKLYKGYNQVRVKITNSLTNESADIAQVELLPILKLSATEWSTCPATHFLKFNSIENYHEGYIVFTTNSESEEWEIDWRLTIADKLIHFRSSVLIEEQTNKNLNMVSFTGYDGVNYIIALIAPMKPKVAENELVACIYKQNNLLVKTEEELYNLKNSYTTADNYKLLLDPRMPEASMGNHSSPNNKDLLQASNHLYYGVVNYTMTGNWTLNFILENSQGRIVKGTIIPADFTPGVEGIKSDLHLDILF